MIFLYDDIILNLEIGGFQVSILEFRNKNYLIVTIKYIISLGIDFL